MRMVVQKSEQQALLSEIDEAIQARDQERLQKVNISNAHAVHSHCAATAFGTCLLTNLLGFTTTLMQLM